MHSQHFAKQRLAQAVSIAIGVSLNYSVSAQDTIADEPLVEEVVVTGIRSSLKRAMDTKRIQGVVDAITAEDIGDFPDTNLAEALQRITAWRLIVSEAKALRSRSAVLAPISIWSPERETDADSQWSWPFLRLR